MNAALIFEVLLYLNSYYYGLFAVCEIGMNVVKALNLDVHNFSTSFGILLGVCVIELCRVIIARRGNLSEKTWPVVLAILLTVPSAVGIVYFILWQSVVLRFEYIICAIQLSLQTMEILFGILRLIPFCNPPEYC